MYSPVASWTLRICYHCTSRSSKCWLCPEVLGTNKSLKAHVAVRHSRLAVVCPGCTYEEKVFKRVADLKFHYQKCHPDGDLKDEAFTESNGFWLCLHPEDYMRVIKPSRRSEEVARQARAAILSMLGKSACHRLKKKNDWYDGWEKQREGYTPTTASTVLATEMPTYIPTPLSSLCVRPSSGKQAPPSDSSGLQKTLMPARSRSSTPAPARSRSVTPGVTTAPPHRHS